MENTGALCSGAMMTRNPLSSVVSVNSTLGSFDCAKAVVARASSNAHSSGLIRVLFTEHLNIGIKKEGRIGRRIRFCETTQKINKKMIYRPAWDGMHSRRLALAMLLKPGRAGTTNVASRGRIRCVYRRNKWACENYPS